MSVIGVLVILGLIALGMQSSGGYAVVSLRGDPTVVAVWAHPYLR